ncbi:sugar ABC transporter substrate-binding protein [Roseomonas terrae]|jgi:polysaccharide export outer membrane protein|uniref:Sugar ABC transporter substrate-binding protein n=1 Tax=Neoroseomonas terrae TaxID=424799 RepID=A0ABS5EKB9_9PROT|nr:XrtA/PEP-CTERM system exopolysaccharide export protein [Neoroseomonas terrae]MBR0651057.1 sugar ABC transporter substrate-binding protein [Neoroseomonas terrae]
MSAHRSRRFHPFLVALLLLPAACAEPRETALPAAPSVAAAPTYVIGPGDTLDIFVHLAPDLSATALPVRPDGRLSIPLVPDVQAAGKTPTVLARELETRLRRYVVEPNVTVMVRSFVGAPESQIRVIGEATEPRAMPYREGMTLLDVMITARGLTRYAAGNRAELVRRAGPDGTRTVQRVRLNDLLRDGDMSQDVPMRPGDTLLIPQAWF